MATATCSLLPKRRTRTTCPRQRTRSGPRGSTCSRKRQRVIDEPRARETSVSKRTPEQLTSRVIPFPDSSSTDKATGMRGVWRLSGGSRGLPNHAGKVRAADMRDNREAGFIFLTPSIHISRSRSRGRALARRADQAVDPRTRAVYFFTAATKIPPPFPSPTVGGGTASLPRRIPVCVRRTGRRRRQGWGSLTPGDAWEFSSVVVTVHGQDHYGREGSVGGGHRGMGGKFMPSARRAWSGSTAGPG